MGRLARHTNESILEAALELVSSAGPERLTIQALSQKLGAPSGSIYHRFPSREAILEQLLLQVVSQFQQGFQEAVTASARPGQVARWVIEWVQQHPQESLVLLHYRREEFSQSGPLQDQLGAIYQQAIAKWPSPALRAAIVDLPYSLVRSRLRAGKPIPAKTADLAEATADFMVSYAS